MSYRLEFGLTLGASQSGAALRAAIVDQSGVVLTQDIASGFRDFGGGFFQWDGNLPTGHQGAVVFYTGSVSGNGIFASGVTVKGISSVNPQETEYPDTYTTSRMASGASAGLLSGQSVLVYSGQLSGQLVTAASGQFVNTPPATISGVFASVPVSSISGTTVVVPPATISGVFGTASLISGQLSGQPVTLLSGLSYPASGVFAVVPVSSVSGVSAVVPTSTISGVFATASLNSGQSVGVYSGQLSGQLVTLVSGASYPASGVFATVPAASVSGAVLSVLSGSLSGQLVMADLRYVSGDVVSTKLAQIGVNVIQAAGNAVSFTSGGIDVNVVGVGARASGQVYIFPGTSVNLLPGNSVFVYSGSLSGQLVTANVTQWQGVAPNPLVSSGRVDAAFNVRTGVARSGTASTIQLDAGAATGVSGVYDGAVVTLVGGTGAGRSRVIQNYGSSGIATVFPNWDASGVPDTTTVFTLTPGAQAFSGQGYPASGAYATVPASALSGVNAVVPPSTLSGVVANSGLAVTVVPATISGTTVTVPVSSISGVTANSGIFASVPASTLSGVNAVATPASGQSYLASGAAVNLLSGNTVQLYSGQSVITALNQDKSGYTAGSISGTTYPASGAYATVPPSTLSGVNATVPVSTLSGVVANSGLYATVLPASLSGVYGTASLNSGQVVILDSGSFVNVWSGQAQIASGAYVTATASVQSGQVYLASGQLVGLLSGQQVVPASGAYAVASLLSGQSVIVSTNQDKLGYSLSSSGLDPVQVESGMNFRQAQSVVLAVLAGRLSGAGTGSILFDGAGVSGTNRVTAVVNQSGDRTVVTFNLPG